MEAIFELLGALIAAFVQALFALVGVVVSLLAAIAEMVFLTLTQGRSAASEKYKQRKEQRHQRKKQSDSPLEAASEAGGAEAEIQPTLSSSQSAMLTAMVVGIVISCIAVLAIVERVRVRRVATTRVQVDKLAESFAVQIKGDPLADPRSGELQDRDAWGRPIELFVDKALLGSLVVVRSSGPDRDAGTADDILAIDVVRASAKEVGGELAKQSMSALRERVARLLPGGDKVELPEEEDVGEN